MPKNTNILMVRHAEKPDKGHGLAVAGQERAQAYTVFFQNYRLPLRHLKLEYLFATADTHASHRPRLTIEPLSKVLGLKINDKHADDDYGVVAEHILENSKYDNSDILICWHHGKILQLAEALGVKQSELPPESNWPAPPWPAQVFGWLLQLSYDAGGNLIPAQTFCVNQQLMYDDYGNDPPSPGKTQSPAPVG